MGLYLIVFYVLKFILIILIISYLKIEIELNFIKIFNNRIFVV